MALLPLRRKACWRFFRPKNPTALAGFEPTNLGTKGQHAIPRPLGSYRTKITTFWDMTTCGFGRRVATWLKSASEQFSTYQTNTMLSKQWELLPNSTEPYRRRLSLTGVFKTQLTSRFCGTAMLNHLPSNKNLEPRAKGNKVRQVRSIISGFHCGLIEIFTLLWCHTV